MQPQTDGLGSEIALTIAVAAAGTGGHVYPALVVARELADRGHSVFFLGGDRVEAKAVPEAGFDLERVEMAGISRTDMASNIRIPGQMFSATARVSSILKERKAQVVLAMGGYITGPAALAAARRRIPLVLHEQNAVAGVANRLAAPLARRILVAFESATSQLRRGQVVGNPLRPSLLEPTDIVEARQRYDLPTGRVLGVFGGSQGARIINDAVVELATNWTSGPLAILHLAGSGIELSPVTSNPAVTHRVVEYEDAMRYFYAACDLVVSRAGAISVSELATTGSPSVLVPYSFGSAAHQAENAAVLADSGAARILHQDSLASLGQMVADLMSDVDSLSAMSRAASSVAVVDAAGKVADVVLEEAARG